MNSGHPGNDELIGPHWDLHELQHPNAMAGLDKGKHPIRPGSTFISTLNYFHHTYPAHDIPSPNPSQFPGCGTVQLLCRPDTATIVSASLRR